MDTGSSYTIIDMGSELASDLKTTLGMKEENVAINERNGEEVIIYPIVHLYLENYSLGEHTCILSNVVMHEGNGLMGFDFFNNNKVFIQFDSEVIWLKQARI